jgi:protein gp37
VGDRTAIEWCDATFNPWWGCVEVSPGCDHCYARTDAKRYGHAVWGKDQERRFFRDKHWDEPMRWDRRARRDGRRWRVFCASMADVLEERDDQVGRYLDQERQRLWALIAMTEATDWLLLTKRPQNYARLVPPDILALPHVWPGTTVESSAYLWRLEHLLRLECAGPAWLSYEPALEGLELGPYLPSPDGFCVDYTDPDRGRRHLDDDGRALEWVLIGGESGPGARPFDINWARTVMAQCRSGGVPIFVKQLGARPYSMSEEPRFRAKLLSPETPAEAARWYPTNPMRDRKGGDPAEWPEDLRVREYPR